MFIHVMVHCCGRVGRLCKSNKHLDDPQVSNPILQEYLFAALQYQNFGYSNGMIVVNILQSLYILDFFSQEDWYVHTIVSLKSCRFV
jgi:hypothetical protein